MLEVNIQGTSRLPDAAFSFTAPKGITAIVGPSGAGKTTLLRALAGLDEIVSGEVHLNGELLIAPTEQRQIGMVFQEARLLPHLTVQKNIELGRKSPVAVSELATQLGIEQHLPSYPRQLSGGERQRVMIARALFGAPKMILLDEPLSALDPELRTSLIAVIREQFQEADIPVLYVTHQMEEAAQLAQNLIIVEGGNIIAQGDVARTMAERGVAEQFDRGVSSTLVGRVSEIDAQYHIARVAVGEQIVEIASNGRELNEEIKLRVWSRDIILAKHPLHDMSARNQLLGEVAAIESVNDAQMDVHVIVEGSTMIARVMRKTVVDMGLEIGRPVYLVFKSASVE